MEPIFFGCLFSDGVKVLNFYLEKDTLTVEKSTCPVGLAASYSYQPEINLNCPGLRATGLRRRLLKIKYVELWLAL
jgi:hypothetical protein